MEKFNLAFDLDELETIWAALVLRSELSSLDPDMQDTARECRILRVRFAEAIAQMKK